MGRGRWPGPQRGALCYEQSLPFAGSCRMASEGARPWEKLGCNPSVISSSLLHTRPEGGNIPMLDLVLVKTGTITRRKFHFLTHRIYGRRVASAEAEARQTDRQEGEGFCCPSSPRTYTRRQLVRSRRRWNIPQLQQTGQRILDGTGRSLQCLQVLGACPISTTAAAATTTTLSANPTTQVVQCYHLGITRQLRRSINTMIAHMLINELTRRTIFTLCGRSARDQLPVFAPYHGSCSARPQCELIYGVCA